MTDLTFTPAVDLLRLYRSGKASPLEVMQAILARIAAANPQVNAVVTLTREAALREARRATSATSPFPIEQPHVQEIDGRPLEKAMLRSYLTYAFSVLGLPAISIPC